MKSLKTVASFLVLSSIPAFAADLPSIKSAPVVAPAPMWSGFYAGLNAGGTWANNAGFNTETYQIYQPAQPDDIMNAALLSGSKTVSISPGFIGGGQIGYNWQVNFGGMGFVTGVEADIQGIASSGSNNNGWTAVNSFSDVAPVSIYSNQQINNSVDYLGTVRGRVGYLLIPTLNIYGTGGLAYGGVNASILNSQFWGCQGSETGHNYFYPGSSSYSNTLSGWTAGGGAEWMFLSNWSAKAEYLYYDLGSMSGVAVNSYYGYNLASDSGIQSITKYSTHFSGNIVRAGVNYHFNFASVVPIVAKF